MRIAFVTTNGINLLFKNWPEYILARFLVARGHEVTIYRYEPAGSPPREVIDGIQVRTVERGRRGPLSPQLRRELRAEALPDVVNIFHIRNLIAYEAGWTFRRLGVPLVHTPIGPLHDDYLIADRDAPLDAPLRYDNLIFTLSDLRSRMVHERRPRRTVRNYLIHAPLRWADRVIALSNHERKTLTQMGIPAERIAIIPLWIDTAYAATLPQEPAELDLPRPLLLYVGQLKYRKGFDLLARAMPAVLARYPTASFAFASHNPSQRAALEEIAREQGTADHLHFLGRPDPAELQRLYRAADALVFPSRYEGFGLPPLEAMAAGCPVITTDVPVVNETICDGENGLLAPYNDPAGLAATIIRLLDDPALRARVIAGGYTTVSDRFNGDRLTDATLAVYRDVVGQAGRRAGGQWG
ncbi:MAG: glycosyltransferase family 4 protein [Thermomicrobiales bacterium]